jgi:hypothetical protein
MSGRHYKGVAAATQQFPCLFVHFISFTRFATPEPAGLRRLRKPDRSHLLHRGKKHGEPLFQRFPTGSGDDEGF